MPLAKMASSEIKPPMWPKINKCWLNSLTIPQSKPRRMWWKHIEGIKWTFNRRFGGEPPEWKNKKHLIYKLLIFLYSENLFFLTFYIHCCCWWFFALFYIHLVSLNFKCIPYYSQMTLFTRYWRLKNFIVNFPFWSFINNF